MVASSTLLMIASSASAWVARPGASLHLAAPSPPCVATTAPRMLAADEKDETETPAILDKSVADPVFDSESPYLGRVPYGFSNEAETVNGRAAMMGFAVAYLQEALVGKGLLEQYGLPYDEGAILTRDSGLDGPVFAVFGLVFAIGLTTGLSYGGEALYRQKIDPKYDGTKLPKLPSWVPFIGGD